MGRRMPVCFGAIFLLSVRLRSRGERLQEWHSIGRALPFSGGSFSCVLLLNQQISYLEGFVRNARNHYQPVSWSPDPCLHTLNSRAHVSSPLDTLRVRLAFVRPNYGFFCDIHALLQRTQVQLNPRLHPSTSRNATGMNPALKKRVISYIAASGPQSFLLSS